MTRTEYLLSCLAEECAEVIQRVEKAKRFGLFETQPGQPLNNSDRVLEELTDLVAVTEMLDAEGAFPGQWHMNAEQAISEKKVKVEHFYNYSKQCGTVKE